MKRPAFTIMELLIVILIIGLLAGISWAALLGAVEQARESRTRSIVNKLDQLIGAKWESYRTRRLPIRTTGATPQQAAAFRLNAIRDLQRMELPDRISDVVDPPADIHPVNNAVYYLTQPSVHRQYQAKASPGWSIGGQSAECLYLIVSTMKDGDKNAIDFFTPEEIGDVDQDGMPEILDGWGQPLVFLRWPVAYTRENGAITEQTSAVDANGNLVAPDKFDILKMDRVVWADVTTAHRAFEVRPLIASGGRDEDHDLLTDNIGTAHRYCPNAVPDNNWPQPFASFTDGYAGTQMDRDGDGLNEWFDNLTNHAQEPQ